VQSVVVPPDTWFALDVIANEDHFTIRVNGTTTADVRDPGTPIRNGHLALQHWSKDTHVSFRKIEIKELTAEAAPEFPNSSIKLPTPVFRWTFEKDATDSLGGVPGALHGGAMIKNGWLQLDGQTSYMKAGPLPIDLRQRTLEAWVALADLNQRNRLIMQIIDRKEMWDGIVYARHPWRWYPGSSSDNRSRDLEGNDEDAKPSELIQLAVVYRSDISITFFRNGKIYGMAFVPGGAAPGLLTYKKGESFVQFGRNA
jgi:hypothetical protein